MELINRDNGQTIAADVHEAYSFFRRLKGLLFTEQLSPGCALHIRPCRSVHTFFMKYSIDVLHLDEQDCIVAVESNVPPGKFGLTCRQTVSVVELPPGTIEQTKTEIGHQVRFEKKRRGDVVMLNKLKGLITEEQGQGMTEYGLVLGVIAVAVVGTLVALKDEIIKIFNDALTAVKSRTPTA
jgi:uncharacterized membrane protein (UPF0127 family)/Flp pilus assembly pilin Flp